MKTLFIILMILVLFVSLHAQNFRAFENANFLIYTNQILIGECETNVAVGVPLINDNLYYGFYLSRIPGLRLEYKFYDYLITGFSLMDNKDIYYLKFHYGIKATKHLRVSMIFTDRAAGLELIFSYK